MSYHVYPVSDIAVVCSDYAVKINGEQIECNTARVSAIPFNRRWPGHQRDIGQSEAVQFISLETDEPLHFEITPSERFDKAVIRPRSLGITPEITEDGRILFTLPGPAYFTVEAYGRNRALHVFADPIKEYRMDSADESLLYYGAGEHEVGMLELKSGQTLFLDEGAVVYACIRAVDAENISILGRGILDNSHNVEQLLYEANAENNKSMVCNATRRHTVQLEYCTNVEIDGITIRDSLVYNIRPIGCVNLNIRNVKIIGCWRYNSDGIDMHNCRDVHIADCFIRTFDDSVCVKGFDFYTREDPEKAVREASYRNGKCYDHMQNVTVEGCVIWNDWGKALEIGAETRAEEICDIVFWNCDIIHVTGPVLDCMNVDYADVHDVSFENIRIEADEIIPAPRIQKSDEDVYINSNPAYMPITVNATVEYHEEYSGTGTRRGKNRNIAFRDIRLYGKHPPIAHFAGCDDAHKTENVLLSNLYHNDCLLRADQFKLDIGRFAENIRYEADPYAQLKKNTVDAKCQLKESSCIRFDNPYGSGVRIMFVGNSITLHGYRPEIGWMGEWGMAASAKEKDYVHLLEERVKSLHPDAAFCICQAADWERGYANSTELLSKYEQARAFDADIIILRIIENCPAQNFDKKVFRSSLEELIGYLDPCGKAEVIVTTSFWHHVGDDVLRAYAEENKLPLAELGDLGEDDQMKAIGLFEHGGVANHPGDKGMKAIADRIFDLLSQQPSLR